MLNNCKAPFYQAPVFNAHAGYLSVLYSRLHIGSPQRFPEAPRLKRLTCSQAIKAHGISEAEGRRGFLRLPF